MHSCTIIMPIISIIPSSSSSSSTKRWRSIMTMRRWWSSSTRRRRRWKTKLNSKSYSNGVRRGVSRCNSCMHDTQTHPHTHTLTKKCSDAKRKTLPQFTTKRNARRSRKQISKHQSLLTTLFHFPAIRFREVKSSPTRLVLGYKH